MDSVEHHVTAPGGQTLEDLLRAALGAEGRPPSRARVRGWILGGFVRVEGHGVLDPRYHPAAGERVDLAVEGGGRSPPAAPGALDGVLHLDRHLLVATWTPPSVVGQDDQAVEAWLQSCLQDAAVLGLTARPAQPPCPRASGLVAAALSGGAHERLRAAFVEGRASMAVTALVRADARTDTSAFRVEDACPGVLRITLEDQPSVPQAVRALEAAGLEVLPIPGLGPPARRPLLLHAGGLRLLHPATGRTLAFSAPPPPAFGSPEAHV